LKSKLLLAVLAIVLATGIVAPLHAQQTQPNLAITIDRTVTAGQYGIIHINDEFTILNNGTTPASYLDFGLPRMFRSNLYYASAVDSSGTHLTVDADVNKTSEFYWMRAHFAQDLGFNKTYSLTVSSTMADMINGTILGYEFNFTAAPILTQDATVANVTYAAPQASTFKVPENTTYIQTTFRGFPALVRTYKPWKAYSTETFYAAYGAVNQYLFDLNSVKRDIIIGSDGTLGVQERYDFHNPGVVASSLTITLMNGAYNVMAYDEVGALWTAPENPSPPYQVQLTPRYSSGIRNDENFTVTVTYNVPQSKYLSQLNWWGSYHLNFTLLDNGDDFLCRNATVTIVAPDGFSITSLKTPEQSPVSYPIQVGQNDRTFRLEGVTSQANMTVGAMVNYLPFWSAFSVLPWIAGLEVVIVAFALVMRFRRAPEVVPVPVENLREFVGLYDERLALSRELVLMEEEVSRGSLVKHEFRRRRKVMETRLDELNKSLMVVKAELRTVSPRFEELIRRLDRAEAEIEASRASMSQVRNQYRAGKTTRETYDTIVNDISKRIDRAEETLETTLITLREEAR
jgi:opacity protein-like surface antigen